MNASHFKNEYELALENFGIDQTPVSVVKTYAIVKRAAFRAYFETSKPIQLSLFKIVDEVWSEMAAGVFNNAMRLGMEQGGAGTSLHFQLMEVAWAEIQRRAHKEAVFLECSMLELLNHGQSTNDTLPTAMVIDTLEKLGILELAVVGLQETLVDREQNDRSVLMVGRTEGQDALPMRWGQYWSAWAGVMERDRWRIARLKERIRVVPLGSTAVGTGLGATAAFRFAMLRHLREVTGLPLAQSQNPCADLAHQDSWAEYAGEVEALAGSLVRLSRELLDMASEPDGVLRHPRLQAGSTQMPAKTNPVMLEFSLGTALEALGEAAKIKRYAQEGRGQINALMPFLWQALQRSADSILKSLGALSGIIPRLTLDKDLSETRLRSSPALLNALAVSSGYEVVRQWWIHLTKEDFSSWECLSAALAKISGEKVEVWRARLDPSRLTTAWEEE